MTAPRWFDAPKPGEIVWCLFPRHRSLQPGPKPRPGLILQVGEQDDKPWVKVAYGTSQRVQELFAGEFAISPADGDAYRLAGLSYPTKFNLAQAVELSFNDQWFGVAPGAPHGQSPKLGVLHPSLMRRGRAAFRAAQGKD